MQPRCKNCRLLADFLDPHLGPCTAPLLPPRSVFKNQLSHLPLGLCRLTALPRLSLYENQLVEVPPEMGDMTGLQEL